jgi:hypothetical protein
MASRVTYKFKSATASDTVIFEGIYISVGELKRAIVEKKGLSRDHAAELLLSEAQSGRGSRAAAAGAAALKAQTPNSALRVRVAPARAVRPCVSRAR